MQKARKTYPTVQAWMEATNTTGERLAELTGIDRSHLSKLLTGSRRCSYEKAARLSDVTGVPVENLVRWFLRDRRARSKASDRIEAAEMP
jgi:transcriptional regulator with XRE-family HTH domain